MSDPRTEQAEMEAVSWVSFEAALEAIPRASWEDAGVLPGWSVKELVWHMAGWLQTCARRLEEMRTGQEPERTGQTVDERNEELAAQARTMSVDAVHRGLIDARALVREEWEALPTIDERAISELADETYEHYDEHREDLERFVTA
ncbi:MAG: maleylpyruvate isomerase N-terminal domain-containing protein [Actinomycetota bacterium]